MKPLIQILSVAVGSSNKIKAQCAQGNYLHTPRIGPDICLSCSEGVNFMPMYHEIWHSNRTCFNCTQVRDENLEVLVSPCNRTQDAEILCRDGYYRYKARNIDDNDTCVKCSVCENVARPCQGYYDTVCCLASYDAVLNKHGFYECKDRERPMDCGSGEFLSLQTEQCTLCPSGTFMMPDKHNHTNCEVCKTLEDVPPNHKIFQPCNQTHPTIFVCPDGYYEKTNENGTNLCEPDLEVTNITDYIPECGADEYLHYNSATHQKTCRPCLSSPCGNTTQQLQETSQNATAVTPSLDHDAFLTWAFILVILAAFFIVLSSIFRKRFRRWQRLSRFQLQNNNNAGNEMPLL